MAYCVKDEFSYVLKQLRMNGGLDVRSNARHVSLDALVRRKRSRKKTQNYWRFLRKFDDEFASVNDAKLLAMYYLSPERYWNRSRTATFKANVLKYTIMWRFSRYL